MWIERRLPRLPRDRALGIAASAVLVGIALWLRALMPLLPPFITFYPAVLLSAFLGGRVAGIAALAATAAAGAMILHPEAALHFSGWGWGILLAYIGTGVLIIVIVDLLDTALRKLRAERKRLTLALRAANAGTWEWAGPELHWDSTFYEVTGLDPARHPPSSDTFLAHVHPDDFPRMSSTLKKYMTGKGDVTPLDEYRFIRTDGRTIWLQTYRAIVDRRERRVTGVTQDITARKESEMQIQLLLREVTHRAKNQYAVIAAVIRETARKTAPTDLAEEVEARLLAMGRSQDLLVESKWEGATIDSVVRSQLDPFGIGDRCEVAGQPILLSPTAVQYLGMALYELATNSIKYGALKREAGIVRIAWSAGPGEADSDTLRFEWRESGGSLAMPQSTGGFGRKVLEEVVPLALQGDAHLTFDASGAVWNLTAPASAVRPPSGVSRDASRDERRIS
jgi:PAS domain S-box-containing protein